MNPYRTAAPMPIPTPIRPAKRVWRPEMEEVVRIGITRSGTHGSPYVGKRGIIAQITYEKGKDTVYGVFLGRSTYAFFFLDELEQCEG